MVYLLEMVIFHSYVSLPEGIYIYTFNHFKNYGFRYRFSHQSNGYPILNRRDPGIDDFITPSAPGSEAEPISCAEKGWCNLVMPLRKAVERWFPIGHIISYIHIYIYNIQYIQCMYIYTQLTVPFNMGSTLRCHVWFLMHHDATSLVSWPTTKTTRWCPRAPILA